AVTEEADHHPTGAGLLRGPGDTGGDRRAVPDRAGGAEDVVAEVGRVERPAPAAVDAGLPADHLGQHPARLAAFRQQVTVAAVVAQHHVVRRQRGADAGRHGLLADARVDAAADVPGLHQVDRALLEPADEPDRVVETFAQRW